ncbi:MAG: response regulator, partial [Myxococcota bacterium]
MKPPIRDRPLVLIVDDDPLMRMLAVDTLDAVGIDAVEADSGRDGLAAFDDHWPDLVLLDVVMPQMDGFEACRAIRDREGGALTPILMMTGLDDLDAIDQAFESGATDFVTKPINYRLLGRRVNYLLRSRKVLDDLRRTEQWLLHAQQVAKLGYWEWQTDEPVIKISPSAAAMLGFSPRFQHRHVRDLRYLVDAADLPELERKFAIFRTQRRRIEIEVRFRVDQQVRHFSIVADPSYDEATRAWRHLGALQDITERRESEAHIRKLACFDTVTGLPNRQTFVDRIRRHSSASSGAALFCILVTNYRDILNSFGTAAADEYARQITRRITRTPLRGHALGRLSSDMFSLFAADFVHQEAVLEL